MTSLVLREQFKSHGIVVGLYSYGCFDPNRIGRGVTIGRYCSFADTSRIFTRNHGIGYISTTPYLYNRHLGMVEEDTIENIPCVIEDDVWMGHNAIIVPGAKHVGRGAVIAAGAVVTRPVDPYTIVGGNPAQEIRKRFDEDIIEKIEATRWWERDLEQLRQMVRDEPDLVFDPTRHFRRSATPGPEHG